MGYSTQRERQAGWRAEGLLTEGQFWDVKRTIGEAVLPFAPA
jgi:hypothetical protein